MKRRLATASLAIVCIAFLVTGSALAEVELEGEIELRATYDSNVLLTNEDEDFELRRRVITDTEEDDVLGILDGDLRLRFPLGEAVDNTLRYEFEVEKYSDLDSEDMHRHRLGYSPRIQLSRSFRVEPWYAVEFDERKSDAEYLRPDYLQNEVGAKASWRLTRDDQLSLEWFYENRDYDNLFGTPFDDYDGHEGTAQWRHKLGRDTYADAELSFLHRDYDDDTLDEAGNDILGRGRTDDRIETGLSVTHRLTRQTLARLGYLYRNHRATGDFYDYDMHRLHGILVQLLPWQMRLNSYAHYEWRDYDDQLAQEIAVDPVTGVLYQRFTGEVRSDRQAFLLMTLTKEITKGFTLGTEYQLLNNDSDDESSEYTSHRIGAFVRYRF